MQFAGGKSRSAGGMIALRAIVCFANADERCSSLQILGTNAICRRQMTIRDRIIHTGCIALSGDLFRLRRNRARGYAPLRETGRVGTRPYAKPGAWIRAPTRNPARGYAPLRGTGRVGTRPYEAIGGEKGPRHKPRAQGCRGLTSAPPPKIAEVRRGPRGAGGLRPLRGCNQLIAFVRIIRRLPSERCRATGR